MADWLIWLAGLGGWAVLAVLMNTVLMDWMEQRRWRKYGENTD